MTWRVCFVVLPWLTVQKCSFEWRQQLIKLLHCVPFAVWVLIGRAHPDRIVYNDNVDTITAAHQLSYWFAHIHGFSCARFCPSWQTVSRHMAACCEGPIPTQIGGLRSLTSLNLRRNKLSGGFRMFSRQRCFYWLWPFDVETQINVLPRSHSNRTWTVDGIAIQFAVERQFPHWYSSRHASSSVWYTNVWMYVCLG